MRKVVKLFDEETEIEIERKYRDGMLITYLAKEYHCHRHTIMRLLKQRGIELEPNRRAGLVLDEKDIQDITKRYRKGVSARELAKDYGTTHKRITNVLRSKGIEIDTKRRQKKSGPKLVIPLKDLLPHYMYNPKPLWEIAEAFGTSRQTIKRNLELHELPIMSVKERRKIQEEFKDTGKLFNRTADWSKAL